MHVWIKLNQPNTQTGAPPIGVESKFSQWVRLVRDPQKQTAAVMWESHDQREFLKNSSGDPVITVELVIKQVDEFIKAFKGANANATSVAPEAKIRTAA